MWRWDNSAFAASLCIVLTDIGAMAKEVYIVLPDMKYDACASSITEKRYRVFSGIEIIFFESHQDSFELKGREKMADTIFEITHCSEEGWNTI